MNFNSPEFAVFLFIVVAVFLVIRRCERMRDCFLLCASYFFYMSWDWRFAGLIAFSTLVDYCVGLGLVTTDAKGKRRSLLLISLATNLGVLALFKYCNFFIDVTQKSLESVGI